MSPCFETPERVASSPSSRSGKESSQSKLRNVALTAPYITTEVSRRSAECTVSTRYHRRQIPLRTYTSKFGPGRSMPWKPASGRKNSSCRSYTFPGSWLTPC